MIDIKLGRTKVSLYTSIKELPIHRHQEFNKLACIDLGVGSTTPDFNSHFSTLHAYLKNNKLPEAMQETINLHNNFFYVIEKISIWSFSFCAFIKSINGNPYESVELDEHKETIGMLSKKGLTTGLCMDTIDEIKKNLIQNLNGTFLIDSMIADRLMHLET